MGQLGQLFADVLKPISLSSKNEGGRLASVDKMPGPKRGLLKCMTALGAHPQVPVR